MPLRWRRGPSPLCGSCRGTVGTLFALGRDLALQTNHSGLERKKQNKTKQIFHMTVLFISPAVKIKCKIMSFEDQEITQWETPGECKWRVNGAPAVQCGGQISSPPRVIPSRARCTALPGDSVLFHGISSFVFAVAWFRCVQHGFILRFPSALSCLCASSRENSVVLLERELDPLIKGCELHPRATEEAEVFPCSLALVFQPYESRRWHLWCCGRSTRWSDTEISGAVERSTRACSQPVLRAGSGAGWLQKGVWSLLVDGGVSGSAARWCLCLRRSLGQRWSLAACQVFPGTVGSRGAAGCGVQSRSADISLPGSARRGLCGKYADCLRLAWNLHCLKITTCAMARAPLQMLVKYSIHK